MKRALTIAGFGVIAGLAVAAAAPTAFARDGGPMAGGSFGGRTAASFADLDVDGNGQITEEDMVARAEARFGEADADGDGAVTPAEMAAAIVEQMNTRWAEAEDTTRKPSEDQMTARAEGFAKRMVSRMDADGNGTLEAAEMAPDQGYGRFIDRFDTDDDNAISQAEFDAMQAERQARGNRMERGKGERGHFGKGDRGHRGDRGWNMAPPANPATPEAPVEGADDA